MAPALLRIAILVRLVYGPNPSPYGDGDIHAMAERAARFVIGVKMLEPADQRRAESDGRDCGAELECLTERLDGLGATHALLLVLNESTSPPSLTSQLVEVKTGATVGSGLDLLNGELEPTVSRRVQEMLTATGGALGGFISVNVVPPDAHVVFTSEHGATPGGPVSDAVPPGTYRVHASLEGHLPVTETVVVEPGAVAQLSLSLESEPTILEAPWLWAGVGAVAAVGLGIASYFIFRPTTGDVCHRPVCM